MAKRFVNELHRGLFNDLQREIKETHVGTFQVNPQDTQLLKLQSEFHEMNKVQNDLADALGISQSILGFNPGSIGLNITQADTLFLHERWYLISNFRQLLNQMYVEHGIIQTLVDVPVDDGMRGGVDIKTEQLDEKEIRELNVWLEREDVLDNVVGRAAKWNRLFGGAGIIILTNQDPATPLDINSLQDSKLGFRAVDMWELFWDKQNTEGYDAELQEQEYEFYNYYSKKIHKSRVRKMVGLTPPSFIRPRLRGWGFSAVESVVNALNQYLKANALIFEVLDEFKVDVYKLKNLSSTLLSPNGAQAIQKRIQMANQQKNFQNALTLDGEDDFIQKQLTFAGMAEVMIGIKQFIASELRMPLTKLFGISAAGFSSGEDDIENYNGMVESQVRAKTKQEILFLLELKCQQKYGFIPDDLEISFKPLRVLSAEQEENVKTQKFNRVLASSTSGKITDLEFREMVNRDNLLPIKLDTDEATLAMVDAAQASEEDDEQEGANKEPSSKVASAKSKLNAPEPKKPKNSLEDYPSPRIVCVGITHKGKVLTGKRKDNGLWAFPGGHMDEAETIEEAVCREALEETGIEINPKDLKSITPIIVDGKTSRNGKSFSVFPFTCELGEMVMPKICDDPDYEFAQIAWVPIDANSPELKPESRHAKNDAILKHLLGDKVKNDAHDLLYHEYNMCNYSVEEKMKMRNEATEAISNPGKVDEGLWEKAKSAAAQAKATDKWAFTTWWYKHHGGKFS